MGRQASAASRSQKWQVAGGRNNEVAADAPSEDENCAASTRIPSSGGSSPSPSELGRQAAPGSKKASGVEFSKEELAARDRWADVESDGEEVKVDDGWNAASGKKSKSTKPAQKTRVAKADPPARAVEAPRQGAAKQPEKSVPAYKAPKQKSVAHVDHYWEESSWDHYGSSGRGGHAWSTSGSRGGGWDEGGWGQKAEARSAKTDFRKGQGRGVVKEKNESFKRGPHVAVNMDSSRLAW